IKFKKRIIVLKDLQKLVEPVQFLDVSGFSWSRRVSVPSGTLVRVEGQALSLRCEVSDFEGPEEQDFDWKATRGAQTVNIISTWEPSFPEQALRGRVLSGDISVHRLGGSVVELRIREARVTDSATYTCSTPSTDATMRGNYDSDVQLRVIPNTLSLAPQVPVNLVMEGRSIRLHCNVSQNFTDGIYLSVTWSIKKGEVLQEDLLTFGPDMGVTVGSSFSRRYAEDEMHLHLDSEGSYSLMLSGAVPADQGMYVCTARQWTREQGDWKKIQEKTAVMGDVTVIPTGRPSRRCPEIRPMTTVSSANLTMRVGAGSGCAVVGVQAVVIEVGGSRFLRDGDDGGPLEAGRDDTERQGEIEDVAKSLTVQVLDNTILAQGDPLNLTCLVSADDLAVLGLEVTWLINATQILTHFGRDGVVTKTSNVLSMSQVGEGDFTLEIQRVELSDMGLYSCRVGAWVQHSKANWYQAAEKTSTPIQVLVTLKGSTKSLLLSMLSFLVILNHLASRFFVNTEQTTQWKRVKVQQRVKVIISYDLLKDPTFTVTLDSPRIAQYPGDPTELVCQVRNISHLRGERLGVSWFYSSSTNEPLAIASMDANGALMPGEKYQSSIEAGLIVVSRVEPIAFKLRLLHTTNVDAGEYACSITTWTTTHQGTWRKSSDHRSRTLKVSLPSKSPGLSVVARTVRQAISSGSTFEMSCQARPKNLKEGVALSVLISMQEGVGSPSHKLASISPDLVFKVEDQHEHSKQDSLSLVKTGREEFLFRIRGVQATDRGFYSCEVVAWIMQNGSNWVEVVKGDSNKIQLTFEHKRPIFDLSINVFTTSVLPWETVKMECIVSVLGTPTNTEDVAYEIRWYQSWGSDTVTLLASMDRWGVVKKSPRNDSSDCSLERLRAEMFVLNIHGTQESDAGEYFCTASPWMRSTTTGVWSRELDVTSKRVFLHVKFAFWDSMKFPLLYGACASLFVGLFSLILGLICAQCCLRDTTHSPRSRVKLMDLEID
ncbi:hypothetical protein P4O66_021317, partial [Electrophorus voltai]